MWIFFQDWYAVTGVQVGQQGLDPNPDKRSRVVIDLFTKIRFIGPWGWGSKPERQSKTGKQIQQGAGRKETIRQKVRQVRDRVSERKRTKQQKQPRQSGKRTKEEDG